MLQAKTIRVSILVIGWFIVSCNKQEFLDKKPRTDLIVPSTLEDFQRLMDGVDMNTTGNLGELSSDDYYHLDKNAWSAISLAYERNAYTWEKEIYEGYKFVEAWDLLYKQVLVANVVLEGLNKINKTPSTESNWSNTKGRALFMRGFAYFNLAQQFCLPYDSTTAENDLGIVIRPESDVTVSVKRSSLKETYDQILSDLTEATSLLPDKQPADDRNRPYLSSAYAALARVCLSIRLYSQALQYADKSLVLYHELIDYNSLDTNNITPFQLTNNETIYQATLSYGTTLTLGTFLLSPNTVVDSTLYASYNQNDLRKSVYYKYVPENGKMAFAIGYSRNIVPFSGLATDELYLIKAECEARLNNVAKAMNTLNDLLKMRFATGSFQPMTANDSNQALEIILQERRKELILRGLRWQDLRRLNLEGRNIALSRNLDGQTYQLPPKSPLYALPIPPEEIRLSKIEQNNR